MSNLVTSAIKHIGLSKLARRLKCQPSNIQRWRDAGRLPQTDLCGLTNYATVIEEMTEGEYKAEELLEATRQSWIERRAAGIR